MNEKCFCHIGMADGTRYKVKDADARESIEELTNTINENSDDINKRLYVTPEDFGCVGNGITNDTTNFQNAINYVQENKNKILWLQGEYLLDNISISKHCTIYFNNKPLIPSNSGSGVFMDINIPFIWNGENPNYRKEMFKDIFIKANTNTNYNLMLSIKCRNAYFNSIKLSDIGCNGVKVTEYEGVYINYLRISGNYEWESTASQIEAIGLEIDREDCYYNVVEISNVHTHIKCRPNIDLQLNQLHLWGGAIGILFTNGVGNFWNSIIFDSLKTCIKVEGDYGANCTFANIQLLGITHLFETAYKNQLLAVTIQSIKGLNNISKLNHDGSAEFTGRIYNSNDIGIIFWSKFNKLSYNVTFSNNNGFLSTKGYQEWEVTFDQYGECSLGHLTPAELNFYRSDVICGSFISSLGHGIIYVNSYGNFSLKLDSAKGGATKILPFVNIPLATI